MKEGTPDPSTGPSFLVWSLHERAPSQDRASLQSGIPYNTNVLLLGYVACTLLGHLDPRRLTRSSCLSSSSLLFLLLPSWHAQRLPHRCFKLGGIPLECPGKCTVRRLNNEVDRVCTPRECDIVLCDGVTTYFSSAAYPIDSMRMSADATKPSDRLFHGHVQIKKHILMFGVHLETAVALPRPKP